MTNIYVAKRIDKKETVGDLIKQYKGTNADCYDLIKDGVAVLKNKKLKEVGIDGNAKLRFQERLVKFIVRLDNGSSIPIEFGLTKTIKSLKDYLHDVKKVSVDQQQMTFNGRKLNDEMTLNDFNVANDSVLCMNLRNTSSMSMNVDVNYINVKLKLNDTTSISDLIKMWKEADADNYDLVVNGKVVPRNMTLREANVTVNSKLDLQERKISFTVRLCNGTRIRVNLAPSKTILNLKEHLNAVEKYPVCDQRISFNGRDLSDVSTLRDCEIKNDSDVILIGRLYGG